MKLAPKYQPSSRANGQPITFLSLFTREEILGALIPIVAVALYWICKVARHV